MQPRLFPGFCRSSSIFFSLSSVVRDRGESCSHVVLLFTHAGGSATIATEKYQVTAVTIVTAPAGILRNNNAADDHDNVRGTHRPHPDKNTPSLKREECSAVS